MNEEMERSEVVVINGAILRDQRLTAQEKIVYSRIAFFKEYFESAEAAAKFLGMKPQTVQRAKRSLEALGYIKCIKNTGRGKVYMSDIEFGLAQPDLQKMNIRPSKNEHIDKNINKTEVRTKLELDNKTDDINKKPLNLTVTNSTGDRRARVFQKPTIEDLASFKKEANLTTVDVESFYNYYESNGWRVGKQPMRDWRAAMRNWHLRNSKETPRLVKNSQRSVTPESELLYTPAPGEDIRDWSGFFDDWERIIGMRPQPTVVNVKAARLLIKEADAETRRALMVALAMRAQTAYITREIKSISSPAELYAAKDKVWAFYKENFMRWRSQIVMRRGSGLEIYG